MKLVLVLIVLITALVVVGILGVGLGLYLGWFKISSRNGIRKPNLILSLDKTKMTADADKMEEQVQDLGHQAAEQLATAPQQVRK